MRWSWLIILHANPFATLMSRPTESSNAFDDRGRPLHEMVASVPGSQPVATFSSRRD
jgi:hypothetical protein